ncbi:hypothetical protein UFOVP813_31 [uncultured Caudovirales phage]|uniref:Uncharacterized protein n=1 Tax=uncultured Caudovirales phage TaxID=2100421 RepID=A0A6J5P2Y4_9CAUD|nr:hypothetical protein UFOVP813_31 [uncultured Caudovirales phage]
MSITINNSIVSKDGDEIGKIEGDTCSLLHAVGPTVKAAISKESGSKLKFVILGNEGDAKDSEDEKGGESGPIGEDGPVGSVGAPGVAAPSGKPERDPILGDKCPLLIAWKATQKGGK